MFFKIRRTERWKKKTAKKRVFMARICLTKIGRFWNRRILHHLMPKFALVFWFIFLDEWSQIFYWFLWPKSSNFTWRLKRPRGRLFRCNISCINYKPGKFRPILDAYIYSYFLLSGELKSSKFGAIITSINCTQGFKINGSRPIDLAVKSGCHYLSWHTWLNEYSHEMCASIQNCF